MTLTRRAPLRRRKRIVTKRSTEKRRADAAWSKAVRARGECELRGSDGIECGGPLQAAHGFPRRYTGTRFVLLNGWCICAGHHRYYSDRWPEWSQVMRERLGETVYEELRQRALAFKGPLDYRLIRDALA